MGHAELEEIVVEAPAAFQPAVLEALPGLGNVRWIIRNERAIAEVLLPAVSLEPGKQWWRIGQERGTHCHVMFDELRSIRLVEKRATAGPGSRSIQWIGPDGEALLKLFLLKQEDTFCPGELACWEALRERAQGAQKA